MGDCGVCCDKKVGCVCPYCNFEVCRGCTQKYLMGLSGDAQCMGCRKGWDRGVLVAVCGKGFLNGVYKNHREMILFERQKPTMPGVQEEITRRKGVKDIRQLINDYRRDPGVSRAERMVAISQLHDIELRLRDELYAMANPGSIFSRGVKVAKTLAVHKCPQNECRGFLDGKWHCPMCDKTTCKKCNEHKCDGHVCDPSAVETMKLLRGDTKGCPKCGTMIFKISGCSQMWCPDCHTAFNWNTLAIETTVIHNPHYFEYMRKQGGGEMARQPGDEVGGERVCGEEQLPSVRALMNYCNDGAIINMYQTVSHWSQMNRRVDDEGVRGLTLKYMGGELSEYQYRVALQRHEKHRLKNGEYAQIRQMFVTVATGLFVRMLGLRQDPDVFKVEMHELLEYVNSSLSDVGRLYEAKPSLLSFGW